MPQVNEFSWFYSFILICIFFFGFMSCLNCMFYSMCNFDLNLKKFTFYLNLN